MRHSAFFNLLAYIIGVSIGYTNHNTFLPLDLEYEHQLLEECFNIVKTACGSEKNYSHYNIHINSQSFNDIIQKCKERDNYYFNKTMISYLDSLVDLETLKQDICINKADGSGCRGPLEGLNANIQETGILILPRFNKPRREHKRTDDNGNEKTILTKEADYWGDEINKAMHNLYYIMVDDLNGYKLSNYFIDFGGLGKKRLLVGYTPVFKEAFKDIMTLNDDIIVKDDKGNKIRYFSDVTLLYPSDIEERFINCYKRACKERIDILFAPEMLGTELLSEVDEMGYSKVLNPSSENDSYAPMLTLAPTYWHNNKNVLPIYFANGKKIADQYKQNGFEYKGEKGLCKEKLVDSPREIVLIHIDQLGRLAFPICADYLDNTYRNTLISTLKASLILCPSYSFGTSNFEQLASIGSAYGVRCIWGNSCSALSTLPEPPDYPCIVSTPIISENSQKVRLKRKCSGDCKKTCLFKIEIPLDIEGESMYEDKNIDYDHIFE